SAYWRERANFAARLLGRLVVRLPSEGVGRVMDNIIAYFKNGEINHPWLQENFDFLFTQTLESLPVDDRLSRLVDPISMPFNDEQMRIFPWPEPVQYLQ